MPSMKMKQLQTTLKKYTHKIINTKGVYKKYHMPRANNKVNTTDADDDKEANTSDNKKGTTKSHTFADNNDEVNCKDEKT